MFRKLRRLIAQLAIILSHGRAGQTDTHPDDTNFLAPGWQAFSDDTRPFRDDRLKLTFRIHNARESLVVELKTGQPLILGRMGAREIAGIFLDLAPFDAQESGVSRKHAAIQTDGKWVSVMDLDSANGTFLNRHKLVPYQRHILRSGDELALGHLLISVEYAQPVIALPPPYRRRNPFEWYGIILYNQADEDLTWSDREEAWEMALALAVTYGGWRPAHNTRLSYYRGMEVGQADASALASALESALPDVADIPLTAVRVSDAEDARVPAHVSAAGYFGGDEGKQKIRDLIGFCRLGAFRIGP
jgi:pSer/pThr/pTyr-binding forkhead associated (FHA) protein